ncbi:uncharacterized protein LOC101851493 [Aplysia californica]|uniref:Uncharacterized protein LOC101851493 n=1 Tax=Aplysia californica TaxID=6500 RepID=A0ABM1VRX2_APLCA|nr:uncharacterized protein LOC101851493 [Aplysia californica]
MEPEVEHSPEAQPPPASVVDVEQGAESHDGEDSGASMEAAGEPTTMAAPAGEEHVPDLLNLLDTIKVDSDDIEVIKREAKEMFNPEKVAVMEKIDELRLQIEEEELKSYLLDFEEGVRDDVVMVGSISLEEVQEEERRLRDEHVLYLEQEAVRTRNREEDILHREEEAKKRMAAFVKEKRAFLERKEELLRQREKLLMDRLHRGFLRAESQLISVLEKRKGEVRTFYGDLMHSEGQYAGSKGRRWKVDWNKTPQPVQVKLKCLRGIKDKCPAGRYVLMVSLYNRIGGHAMRWSKLKGQQWGCATLPLFHEGNFYNTEMKLDQSLFTVLPPKLSLRPGMVLVFELFLLRGSVVSTDHVVAWGAFPICDGQFDIVEGRYHCPFLRGPMDSDIDKHEKIEELIASDLDHWMCNLYFEIIRLPRYFAGQKEYEVELQFSSGLTGHPDRVKTGWEENRDGEEPEAGSSGDVSTDRTTPTGLSQLSVMRPISAAEKSTVSVSSKVKLNLEQQDKKKKMPTTVLSRVFQREYKKLKLPDSDDESEDERTREMSEEKMEKLELEAIKREKELKAVKGMDGIYYKRYQTSPADDYFKHMFTMLPKTQLLAPKKKERKLTRLEELEQHTFSVQPPFSCKGRVARQGRKKMSYVARQFFAELGLSQWRSRDFWAMLILMIIVFWIRLYLHYIGQWLFLSAIDIPINEFTFLPHTVTLNYQATLLEAKQEIAVVVLGPMMNVLVFSFLVFFAWVVPKFMGVLPDMGSKFIMAYGILTFFDPLLICIVDSILGRYEDQAIEPIADFAKLYWHFKKAQGEGLPGIFLPIFLYTFTSFFAVSILYMYFLRLHNNGRLLDVYWRLHGDEDQFFQPYDLEISNQELSYICRKSEQWRGEEGARRKVAVYDYIWEEDEIDDESVWHEENQEEREERQQRKEITTHVSIHTVHLDGLRELYRHFLRLPDGAIVEVFGDMSIPGMDKDVKAALEKGSRGIENIMGSQPRVRGRQEVHTSSGFRPDHGESPSSSSSSSSGSSASLVKKSKDI